MSPRAASAAEPAQEADEAPDLRAEPDYYDLIDMPAVEAMTSLSHATIYARIREGSFPRGRQAGPQAVRWYRGEVRKWNRTRPETGAAQ